MSYNFPSETKTGVVFFGNNSCRCVKVDLPEGYSRVWAGDLSEGDLVLDFNELSLG